MITIGDIKTETIFEAIDNGDIANIDDLLAVFSLFPDYFKQHIVNTYNLIVESYATAGQPLNIPEALHYTLDAVSKEIAASKVDEHSIWDDIANLLDVYQWGDHLGNIAGAVGGGLPAIDIGDLDLGFELPDFFGLRSAAKAVDEAAEWAKWLRKNWLWILAAVTIVIIIIIAVVYFLIIEPKSAQMMQMVMAMQEG